MTYISEKYATEIIMTESVVGSGKITKVTKEFARGTVLACITAFRNKSTYVNPNYPNHVKSISSRLSQSQRMEDNGTSNKRKKIASFSCPRLSVVMIIERPGERKRTKHILQTLIFQSDPLVSYCSKDA